MQVTTHVCGVNEPIYYYIRYSNIVNNTSSLIFGFKQPIKANKYMFKEGPGGKPGPVFSSGLRASCPSRRRYGPGTVVCDSQISIAAERLSAMSFTAASPSGIDAGNLYSISTGVSRGKTLDAADMRPA